MSKLNCDISKFEHFTNDFNDIVNQYINDINDIYNIINELPLNSWFGSDATSYIAKKNGQKNEIDNFNACLSNFSQNLSSISEDLTSLVWSIRRND